MLEGVRAAKKVIVIAEEIVAPEVISSDPNRTVIPGFLVTAVVESPLRSASLAGAGLLQTRRPVFHGVPQAIEDAGRVRPDGPSAGFTLSPIAKLTDSNLALNARLRLG